MHAAMPAWADDAEDCGNAENLLKTEPARAVAACRRLADQGNAEAQSSLGDMYAVGHGVPQDYAEATSVAQDYAEATTWYRKAADHGYAEAQSSLGDMYADGHGVPQNYAEAMKWYRKAADQGYADALASLGTMYHKGQGVAQDYVQAHMWLSLAATRYPASDAAARDKAVTKRDKAAGKMTSAQIAEAQKLADEWRAAHPNLPDLK
jgi:TPR repeat protein